MTQQPPQASWWFSRALLARPRHRAPSRPRSRGCGRLEGGPRCGGRGRHLLRPCSLRTAGARERSRGSRLGSGRTAACRIRLHHHARKILTIDLVADPAVLREFDLAVLNDWRPVLRSGPIRGTLSSTSSGSNAVSEDRKRLGLHAPSATEPSSSATSPLMLRVGKRGMPEPSDHHESLCHDLCARARSDSKLRTGADN